MLRELRMAPWRRAPVLLLRRPGVALALFAAALVAALPAAALGPFLSSSQAATVHHQIQAGCSWKVGAYLLGPLDFRQQYLPLPDFKRRDGRADATERADFVAARAAETGGLGSPLITMYAQLVYANNTATPLTVMTRTDALKNVEVLDGPSGTGLWITDEYAEARHLKVGDALTLVQPRTIVSVQSRVAAIYKSLRQSPDQPYWCDIVPLYRPPDGNAPSPQIALTDEATYLDLASKGAFYGHEIIAYPLANPNLAPDKAVALNARLGEMGKSIRQVTSSGLGTSGVFDSDTKFTTDLSRITRRGGLARSGMLPATVPVTAAGVLVGLLVVGAAAVFWVQRRRRELVILSVHGVAARALGLKALLEAAPALIVGAALGWLGARLLVERAGPDPVLSADATPLSLYGVGLALLLSLLTVAVVAGMACRSLADQRRARHHRILRAIPWELALLASAVLLWRVLSDDRQLADDPSVGVGSVAHVPGKLLVVPIVVVAGLSIFAARLAIGYLTRLATRRVPRRPAAFLSWRRMGRQAAMTAVLAAATAVPIGLSAYGNTVTGSVQATIVDEARLLIGTDVVLTLARPSPIPPSLAGRATAVQRLDGASIDGVRTDLLAVDPKTFARDAFWDRRLGGGSSLAHLLSALDTPGTVLTSAQVPVGQHQAQWTGDQVLGGHIRTIPVTALPGQTGGSALGLVPAGTLGDDTQYAVNQLWVRGDVDEVRLAAQAAHLPVTRISAASDIYRNTLWEPLTYTFDYLTALSLLTGLVTIVGLLLYLEAQAPGHRRSYVLLRRMGLRAGSHRRALLGELAVPLAGGLIGGFAVAAGLVAVLSPDFEMNPFVLPDTVVRIPYRTLALIAAAVVIVAVAATLYAQRRIGRANPSEVLRDTD